jgi:glutamate-1-semialdehyde 2,1-aminomutase
MTVNRVGSMFTFFFNPGPVTDWDCASQSDIKRFGAFFRGLLEAGVYLPCSQYEAAFLSAAHTAEDIDATIATAEKVLAGV